jgi:HD-like signal output (HDOD) protein
MITILSIIQDKKQAALFQAIFTKLKIKIITTDPTYGSYLKSLQYDPDIIILELPQDPTPHLKFLTAIRRNKAIEQKPFILFGPQFNEKVISAITSAGGISYLPLPLDLKKLIDEIRICILKAAAQKHNTVEKNQLSKIEMNRLFDKTVPKQTKIELMRKHIGKLLAFPATVASILKVTQNDRSGAAELAQVLKSDPAVSAEILRIVNSVYYSRGGGKRVLDVKDAVVRIGFVETKNISMSLSVFKVMNDKNYATGFNHTDFWFHCIATATIAEHLAKSSQLASPEEAFIGGLLHDLGTLLLNEYFNHLFLLLLDKTTSEGIRFLHLQKELLGFNHNDLMEQLFQEWKFPDTFCSDIMYFGSPQTVTREFLLKRPLPAIIGIAETIAKSYQIGQEADCCVDAIGNDTFEALRMPFGVQMAFLDKIYNDMNMFNSLLKISKGTFPQSKKLIKNANKINLLCYSFNKEVFSPVVEYLRVQGYTINYTTDIKDFAIKGSQFHAFLLTDGHGAVIGDIKEIANQPGMPFSGEDTTNESETTTSSGAARSKVIVFDAKNELSNPFPANNVVTSRYPVDLRNIDIVLSCLLLEQNQDLPLNIYGSFKPIKNVAGDGTKKKIKVLLAHSKTEIRTKIANALANQNTLSIEPTDDGFKAMNLAKTSKEELALVIIQLNISVTSCKEVITQIMTLPNHKRAKYILCIDETTTKEQLVPLVQLGIRNFIKESMTLQEIESKVAVTLFG